MPVAILRRALLSASLAALLVAAVSPAAADDPVPQNDREGIEAALRKRAAELLAEKDKNGVSYKRGSYSRSFKKVDANTYQVGFHVDTVEPSKVDPKTDQLRTDRLILTVKRGAPAWTVAKEDVAETVSRIYRGWYSSDEIYKFDSFKFEKEGLKLTATGGYAYRSYREGKSQGFRFFADQIDYEYIPPPDTGYYGLVRQRILKEHPEDLQFKAESVTIGCDPESCDSIFATAFQGLAKVPDPAGAGGATAQRFSKAFGDEIRDVEKNRRDNPFSGFWLLPEPERRYWLLTLKKSGADHFATLNYDNWQPWEMGFYLTGYGRFFILGPYGPFLGTPLFAYYSEDTRKSGIPAYSLEARDDIDGRDYEVNAVNGDVSLALEDAVTLTGDVTFGLTVKREIASIPFAIARANVESDVKDAKNPRLFVNSIQDAQGNELTWVKRGPFDGLLLFPKPIESGTKLTVRMQFTSLDAIRKINPTYSSLDRGGWLPLVRFADFIHSFDLTVRTPEKFTVLGIGKNLENTVANGVRTTRWTSEAPVSFSTIIFGDYISGATGKYKATKKDGTEIPVNVYVDKTSTAALDTKLMDVGGSQADAQEFGDALSSGARDIRGKQLGPIATQAAVALNLYREIYDVDYPFAKLDLVADPEGTFYGQAPSSIIYLGFGVFRGEAEVAAGNMFAGGSRLSKFNKDVVAHEAGHQWWGSVIVNSNQRNYWFVETMAEVSSAIYVERVHGKKKYLEKIEEWRNNVLENEQLTNVQNNYTVWAGENGFGSVQSNIYNKGPYAFHVFRSTFGDEKFYALLKEMAKELQHKEIVTRDIQDVMEKVVGGNMDWFFDQWIRGIGKPQYAIFWTKRKNEQGKWLVEGTIKQRVVYGKYNETMPGVYYRGVAPLTFVDSNGKEVKEAKPRLVQGPETAFKVIVADEPEQVLFNKDGEILAEELLVNRSW